MDPSKNEHTSRCSTHPPKRLGQTQESTQTLNRSSSKILPETTFLTQKKEVIR